MVNYHDSSGGHSDLWDYIEGNASRTGEAEERIAKLEQTVLIYGEMLDDLRNKVYALEHGITALAAKDGDH